MRFQYSRNVTAETEQILVPKNMIEVFFPKGFDLISKVCRPVNLIMVFTLGVKYSSTDISSSKCWREFKKFGKIYFMSLKISKRKVTLKSNFEPTLLIPLSVKI